MTGLGWPLEITGSGLTIAATCTLRQLAAFRGPPEWSALPLLDQCCAALAGSFKISREATVGGNVCLALPAGPMIALAVGLDGVAVVWPEAGGERRMPIAELVTGVRRTTLHPAMYCAPSRSRTARCRPAPRPATTPGQSMRPANLPIVWCDWSTPAVQSSESRSVQPPRSGAHEPG